MKKNECIAMVLAGGRGERLGALTSNMAKPMVHFGGNYRIIDFALSNCKHSGIQSVGILSQYRSDELHHYIDKGRTWGLDSTDSVVFLLPPLNYEEPYTGTANAIYQNIQFIDHLNPEYILILSGDHIYKMDYQKMLDVHKKVGAHVTIGATRVGIHEASRFGVLKVDEKGLVNDFEEKPLVPKSDLASMGIYIFNWAKLKQYLLLDNQNPKSQNDFGKNIIPAMLAAKEKVFTYSFSGYWRDVGTIQSLWESNMDLLQNQPKINLSDRGWNIFSRVESCYPFCMSNKTRVNRSVISEGCKIYGRIEKSVLADSVHVGEGAEIIESVIMPNVTIGKNVKIYRGVIGAGTTIAEDVIIGSNTGINMFINKTMCSNGITLVAPNSYLDFGLIFEQGSYIEQQTQRQARYRSLPVF